MKRSEVLVNSSVNGQNVMPVYIRGHTYMILQNKPCMRLVGIETKFPPMVMHCFLASSQEATWSVMIL